MSPRRLRLSEDSLTAAQKSAEGIVGRDVGKASEALREPKGGAMDRLSRKRWPKARTRGGQIGHESQERHATEYPGQTGLLFGGSG